MQTASGVLMKSKLHVMCRVPSSRSCAYGFGWTKISDAWNEDRTCNSNCSERSVQDTNCDDSCSSARGAKEQLADRHRRVERSAMRDPATAKMRQRCISESRMLSQGAERDLWRSDSEMQDWKEQQVLREEQVTRLQALVHVQEHRKEQRSSARCCPGSVPRTSSDHEERWVACEQSSVPLVHNVASREPRALISISSTSWEGRCRRSFQSSRVQRLLTKQQGTFSGWCKIVFRVVAVNRMQQFNEPVWTSLTGTFPLGDVESTIRVPIELSLPRDACLQDIWQVVPDRHETSGKCNWLYRSNVFQVSKHGFWNHCNKEEWCRLWRMPRR